MKINLGKKKESETIGNQYRALKVQETDIQLKHEDVQKYVYFNSYSNNSLLYAYNMEYVYLLLTSNFKFCLNKLSAESYKF